MADKDKAARRRKAAEKLAQDMKESTHKIWLAGLGVFDAAREEGGKFFKRMVKKGRQFEERARPQVEAAVKDAGHALHREVDRLNAQLKDLQRRVEAMRAAAVAKPAGAPAEPSPTVAAGPKRKRARPKRKPAAKKTSARPKGAARKRPSRPKQSR